MITINGKINNYLNKDEVYKELKSNIKDLKRELNGIPKYTVNIITNENRSDINITFEEGLIDIVEFIYNGYYISDDESKRNITRTLYFDPNNNSNQDSGFNTYFSEYSYNKDTNTFNITSFKNFGHDIIEEFLHIGYKVPKTFKECLQKSDLSISDNVSANLYYVDNFTTPEETTGMFECLCETRNVRTLQLLFENIPSNFIFNESNSLTIELDMNGLEYEFKLGDSIVIFNDDTQTEQRRYEINTYSSDYAILSHSGDTNSGRMEKQDTDYINMRISIDDLNQDTTYTINIERLFEDDTKNTIYNTDNLTIETNDFTMESYFVFELENYEFSLGDTFKITSSEDQDNSKEYVINDIGSGATAVHKFDNSKIISIIKKNSNTFHIYGYHPNSQHSYSLELYSQLKEYMITECRYYMNKNALIESFNNIEFNVYNNKLTNSDLKLRMSENYDKKIIFNNTGYGIFIKSIKLIDNTYVLTLYLSKNIETFDYNDLELSKENFFVYSKYDFNITFSYNNLSIFDTFTTYSEVNNIIQEPIKQIEQNMIEQLDNIRTEIDDKYSKISHDHEEYCTIDDVNNKCLTGNVVDIYSKTDIPIIDDTYINSDIQYDYSSIGKHPKIFIYNQELLIRNDFEEGRFVIGECEYTWFYKLPTDPTQTVIINDIYTLKCKDEPVKNINLDNSTYDYYSYQIYQNDQKFDCVSGYYFDTFVQHEKYVSYEDLEKILSNDIETETSEKITFRSSNVRSITRDLNNFELWDSYKLIINYEIKQYQEIERITINLSTDNVGVYTFELTNFEQGKRYDSTDNQSKYCFIYNLTQNRIIILLNTETDEIPSEIDTFIDGDIKILMCNKNYTNTFVEKEEFEETINGLDNKYYTKTQIDSSLTELNTKIDNKNIEFQEHTHTNFANDINISGGLTLNGPIQLSEHNIHFNDRVQLYWSYTRNVLSFYDKKYDRYFSLYDETGDHTILRDLKVNGNITAQNIYTKSQIDSSLNNLNNNINASLTELNNKIDNKTIDSSIYYTKDEVDDLTHCQNTQEDHVFSEQILSEDKTSLTYVFPTSIDGQKVYFNAELENGNTYDFYTIPDIISGTCALYSNFPDVYDTSVISSISYDDSTFTISITFSEQISRAYEAHYSRLITIQRSVVEIVQDQNQTLENLQFNFNNHNHNENYYTKDEIDHKISNGENTKTYKKNKEIFVKYKLLNNSEIFDTNTTIFVSEDTEYIYIDNESYFPEEYRSNNCQYPYNYKITEDNCIILYIDNTDIYNYNGTNIILVSDKTLTIDSNNIPLIAHNGEIIRSLDNCFSEKQLLKTVDLSNLDISNIISMNSLFKDCLNLTTVIMPNCEPIELVNIGEAFIDCSSLENIQFSPKFITNKLNIFNLVFARSAIKNIDLSMINTENVEYINNLFQNCSELETVNISNFKNIKYQEYSNIFLDNVKLHTIYCTKDIFEIIKYQLINVDYWIYVEELQVAYRTDLLENVDIKNSNIKNIYCTRDIFESTLVLYISDISYWIYDDINHKATKIIEEDTRIGEHFRLTSGSDECALWTKDSNNLWRKFIAVKQNEESLMKNDFGYNGNMYIGYPVIIDSAINENLDTIRSLKVNSINGYEIGTDSINNKIITTDDNGITSIGNTLDFKLNSSTQDDYNVRLQIDNEDNIRFFNKNNYNGIVLNCGTTGTSRFNNDLSVSGNLIVNPSAGQIFEFINGYTANYIRYINTELDTDNTSALVMGKNTSNNECMTFRYVNALNPYLSLGFWGNDNIFTINTSAQTTINGNLNVNGNIITTTNYKFSNGIGSIQSGHNYGGYITLATQHDVGGSILARQYDNSGNIRTTLTILDGSGNTIIPNKLSVNGTLNNLTIGTNNNSLNKNSIPSIDNSGVMNIGKYIDFHDQHGETCDYCIRMRASNASKSLSFFDSSGNEGVILKCGTSGTTKFNHDLSVSGNLFVSGIICNTADNRYIKVPRHIDLNNETTKWKTTLHNSENALHVDMFDDKGNWVTKNTLCDASGNALIRGNLNVYGKINNFTIAGERTEQSSINSLLNVRGDLSVTGNNGGGTLHIVPTAWNTVEFLMNQSKFLSYNISSSNLTVGSALNTGIINNRLTINDNTLRYWNPSMNVNDKMYLQIGKNHENPGDNFWFQYTNPGQMKFNFYPGTTMMDMNNDTKTTTIYNFLNVDGNLNVSGTLNGYKIGTSAVSNTNYKANKYIPIINEDGVIEVGKYIDFHEYTNSSDTEYDYKARIECNNGQLVTSGNLIVKKNLTIEVNGETNGLHVVKSDLAADTTTAIALGKSATNHQCGAITYKNSEIPEFGIGFWYHDLIISCKCTAGQETPNINLNGITAVHSLKVNGVAEFSNPIKVWNCVNLHDTGAANDYARIRFAGSSNDGSLEIATADDGTEPIYVRQYSSKTFDTVKRTLTLLDGNGNTFIPGELKVNNTIWFTNPSIKLDSFEYNGDPVIRVNGRLSVTGTASFDSDIWCKGKKVNSNETVTHTTNVVGEIGTFCESTGEIYDEYEKISETDCICAVKQSTTLNKRIIGIITGENEFASHGDVLVKIVPGDYEIGDILVPDENGYGKKASETDLMFMILHAIPRPKITSLNTGIEGMVAVFII